MIRYLEIMERSEEETGSRRKKKKKSEETGSLKSKVGTILEERRGALRMPWSWKTP